MNRPCGRPLDPAALLDYWLGEGPGPDDEAIEEHLLACDDCGRRLRGIVALAEGVRVLGGEGAVEMIVTPSFLEKASREGLRAREYRLRPGEHVNCTVTRQDDFLVARLVADLTGVSRLDIVAEQPGRPPRRIEDVPVGPGAGEVIVAQAMPAMRALGRDDLRLRVLSVEPGGERVLGEYDFHHSPS